MRKTKIFFLTIGAILIALVALVLKTFRDAGEFREIVPRSFGALQSVAGVQSSEDITINHLTGIAYISSTDRRRQLAGLQPRQGGIFVYDLNAATPRLIEATSGFEKAFNPHGIAIYTHEDSSVTLFAINHNNDGDFVEIFDEQNGQFVHRQSVSSPLMFSPNDLIAVSANSFYVTNDHGNRSAFGRMLEEYLQLNRSYVLYYDGSSFRIVVEGLAYANGINISNDGSQIFVAATVDHSVFVYDREAQTGDLIFRERIDLKTGVDNVEIDRDGNLWIGAHPKLLTFVDYSKDASLLSPSQVLKIHPQASGGYQVDEIFLDDGSTISGSSVAAAYKNMLLIGSVFDEKFLVCIMDDTNHNL
jgi:arylesterase/paraoxonase